MNAGVQIGPECLPGFGAGGGAGSGTRCGAEASATERSGSGGAADGLAGDALTAWGDGGFQSGWHQFIEALGLRSSEEPAEIKTAGTVSAPSSGRPGRSQALSYSGRESGLKGGNTVAAPREAPEVRTDTPAGRKAGGGGSKARVQAHESRKVDGLNTTPSHAEPALGSGVQPVAVSAPDMARSRVALPPTGGSVAVEGFASESRGARLGGLTVAASREEELVKGAMAGPGKGSSRSVAGNVPADVKGGGSENGKGVAAASGQEPEPERTEASGNPGLQDSGPHSGDSLQRHGTSDVTAEGAIANAVAAASNHSQAAANAPPSAAHNSAVRSLRAIEPSLVRGVEKTTQARMAGESVGGKRFSIRFSGLAAQDAGSSIPVRDPAGIGEVRGKQEGWVDPARAAGKELSGVTGEEMTGEETFARLDSGSASRPIHWVQAGAHHAEAGYLDPALGWVGVRAESSGGGVHAAVLPGSPEAAQVLGSHLGGLNAFLAQEHGPHATATMAAPHDGRYGAGTDLGNSAGGASHDDADQNGARTGKESDSPVRTAARAARVVDRSIGSDGSTLRRAGTHVSVMA
jgi:hypothetical protein